MQLHSQTKINLIKTQFLKEWWLLGFLHSSVKILWCPEGSLHLGINRRCQKDLWRRHQAAGWDKDNSSSFYLERHQRRWCEVPRFDPYLWTTYLYYVSSLRPNLLSLGKCSPPLALLRGLNELPPRKHWWDLCSTEILLGNQAWGNKQSNVSCMHPAS